MELIQEIVVEGESYPRRYISIYKVKNRKVVVNVTIPHPPSDQALRNFAECIVRIMRNREINEADK